MTVTGQRIYRSDSSFRDDNSRHPPIHFENSDAHRHWHLRGAARYSLWDEAGSAEVAPASKVGFCLLDSVRVDSFAPSARYTRSATQYCGQNQPNVTQVFEGISPGWLDLYPADLPFQWVDVSDVAPGRYRLGADVDPDDFVIEGNEGNNGPALAASVVTVPGYVASPVTAAGSGPQTIALTALPHGSPGPPVFAIESAPAQGTLSVPAGVPLSVPQVVYTPRPGFAGNDTFTYSARDSSSPFPLRARAALVTVTVPPAAASGNRLRLLAGLRFRRHGRFLRVRARATRSGVLRILVKKGKRRLGSCRKRVRAGRRFTCRIKLRRHASLIRARAIVSLRVDGRLSAVETYRVAPLAHEYTGSSRSGSISGSPSLTLSVNCASRFSRNDVTPSRASSDCPREKIARESARCASIGCSAPSIVHSNRRASATDTGAVLSAISRASPFAAASSCVLRVHASHQPAGVRLLGGEHPARRHPFHRLADPHDAG